MLKQCLTYIPKLESNIVKDCKNILIIILED